MQKQTLRALDRRSSVLAKMADGRLHTADQFAAATGFGVRTIYRDIRALKADGAPIIGEAGAGYMLRKVISHG